jgi:hypothetical protein
MPISHQWLLQEFDLVGCVEGFAKMITEVYDNQDLRIRLAEVSW